MTVAEEALVEKIAWKVGDAVIQRLEAVMTLAVATAIRLHAAECPTQRDVSLYRARAGGFILAFSLIGGFVGALLVVIGKLLWDRIVLKP